MKSKLRITSSQFYANHFPKLLFLISVVISIVTTYYVSAHYIDSDTSSELVLARHWIETGKILSPDWFYATELRFLHVQWIYVPLMFLLDDWLMVRYIGALIMQALYITSFACLVHAARKSKNFFFYGASLLLLPVSVTYGRIVLYHNHYLPNITISFFLLALSLHFAGKVDWHSRKTWLRLFFLAALSFAAGLNSIRQLMITHAPLLLAAVVFCWIEDAGNDDPSQTAFFKPANWNLLFCGACAAFFSLVGLKTQGLLCEKLGIQIAIQSETNILSFVGFDNIKDILYGFFHQFGYRNDVSMLSVSGILSLGGIFTGCYLVFLAAKRLLQRENTQNCQTRLLSTFFLAHVAVMLLIFLLTKGSVPKYYYPLYLSLCYPWAVPLLLITFEDLPDRIHLLHPRKFFAVVSVLILLLSSAINHSYFQGSDCFPQTYEGLSFHNRDKKAELTKVVDLLMEQGYDKGYASYWECNIVTEMTNGSVPMVLINDQNYNQPGNLHYRNWLTTSWIQESPCEKPFLLLTENASQSFLDSDSYPYCTQIYAGQDHVVYSIDDLEGFIKTLYV